MAEPAKNRSPSSRLFRLFEALRNFAWGEDHESGDQRIVISGKRALPKDFPIALVEFTRSGRILTSNNLFRKKFFEDCREENDLFRRNADPQYVLTEIINPEAVHGHITNLDREYGRIDFFYNWDAGSNATDLPLKVYYSRDLEGQDTPELAVTAKFEKERYFRYWITNRPYDEYGEKVHVACFVDITREETYRLELEEAERNFSERLSLRLVHRKFRDCGAYAHQSRPISGPGRAGGDFFVLWPLTRRGRSDLVLVMFGDAAGKDLIAASVVQLVASVLRGIGRLFKSGFIEEDESPADQIIKILSEEIAETSVFRVAGLDGIIVVLDFEENVLHWAEGKFGAFILSQGNPANLEFIGATLAPGTKLDEEVHPPIYGRKGANFSYGEMELPADAIIGSATDGLRDMMPEKCISDDMAQRLVTLFDDAAKLPENSPDEAANAKDHEDDGTKPENEPLLQAVVDELFRHADGQQKDDQLAVAVSTAKLYAALIGNDERDNEP